METTRLFLVRHGRVVGHEEPRYNGHNDVELSKEGRRELEHLSEYLKDVELSAIYSSDLKRSYKSALVLAEKRGMNVEAVAALREIYLGMWEGLTRSEVVERFPSAKDFTFRDLATKGVDGGETLVELKARVLPALKDILDRHRGKNICIVAHGGVNRVILCDAMGLDVENFFRIEQDYGCLNIIDYFSDGFSLVKLLNGGPNQNMGTPVIY
ncbi:MAG TPA: histidine phosphatase family protein [Deltaproteobacteria bacterium]|nr:histidine phosphatase family protein [Deltaproteobacteria bacterium]